MNVEEEAERLSLMKATNLINNSVSTLSDKLHWSLSYSLVYVENVVLLHVQQYSTTMQVIIRQRDVLIFKSILL